jgi:cobalamin biosynthesis protein CobC
MLEHGGNLNHAAQLYGIPLTAWLDLSTGLNPHHYPIPDIPASAWQRLPEDHDDLIEAACQYYGCTSALPSAGSQAIIQLLPKLRHLGRIAMPRSMYQEHAYAWEKHGHNITFFDHTPDDETFNQSDVVVVCNPNNPTGKRYTKDILLQWHQQLIARGACLVVDEAFIDITPEESVAAYSHLEGLLVLRSLGKFFGLAGARVGFLLAHPAYLKLAQKQLGPWSVTGASRYIATQALLDRHWQQSTRLKLLAASDRLQQLLTQYGLSPNAGTALFQYIAHPQALEIQKQLAQQAVWIRLFKQPSALRFGLPTDNDWDKLEHALNHLKINDSQNQS